MNEHGVGERIRSLRERRAWTQEQLAVAAGVSTRTVQRAEEGTMAAETRAALAAALDVPVESLAPVPPWPRIVPVLLYEDAAAAVDWLVRAFGFTVREKVTAPGGQVLHAELAYLDGLVMLGTAPPGCGRDVRGWVYVFVQGVEEHLERARAAGARITSDLESSYGQRRYRALDVEGHAWCFSEPER